MRKYSKTSSLIHNMVILSDFVVLNVLFYFYAHVDFVAQTLVNDAEVTKLQLLANFAFVIAQYFFSTVVHDRRATFTQVFRQVTCLVVLQTAVTYITTKLVMENYMHEAVPDNRFSLFFAVVLYIGILFSRFCERVVVKHYRRSGHNQRRVVFIGSNPSMIPVYDYLVGDPSIGYHVNGYFANEPMENTPEGLVYRGTLADLDKLMENHLAPGTVEELYCTLPLSEQHYILKLMKYCNNNTIHFYYVPAFSSVLGHSFRQEIVGDTAVFTNYEEPLLQPGNKLLKRTFDIAVSSCVLICLLPFIPFIALAIYISSPGPIFFKQARTGINGRSFYCYKFRSMHVNKDADLVQATKNDPRKFAFGNFMRKTNIDELPQFFNVLKGDMSIVGPRPHMLHHTEVYRELIDKYMVRHFAKPGITGWAQVTGFRGETKELWQMEGRVQRDIWYIEHWSIWLDLRIIWKTAKQIIVPDKNAY